jgi:hypothetical protein
VSAWRNDAALVAAIERLDRGESDFRTTDSQTDESVSSRNTQFERRARDNTDLQGRAARGPRPCAECGEVFTPPRPNASYCSNGCRQKAYRRRRS